MRTLSINYLYCLQNRQVSAKIKETVNVLFKTNSSGSDSWVIYTMQQQHIIRVLVKMYTNKMFKTGGLI